MKVDEESSQNAEQASQDMAATAADAARSVTSEAAAGLQDATAAAADRAEQVNLEGAKMASDAMEETSDVFGAARERLNSMAGALPQAGQELFRPFQAGSDAFGKGLQSSYATAMEGMAEFNSKAIAAWRSNAESTIKHWQNLASVKSLSEAIALNAEHTRRQLETVATQTRELSALATRIARDSVDPLKVTGR